MRPRAVHRVDPATHHGGARRADRLAHRGQHGDQGRLGAQRLVEPPGEPDHGAGGVVAVAEGDPADPAARGTADGVDRQRHQQRADRGGGRATVVEHQRGDSDHGGVPDHQDRGHRGHQQRTAQHGRRVPEPAAQRRRRDGQREHREAQREEREPEQLDPQHRDTLARRQRLQQPGRDEARRQHQQGGADAAGLLLLLRGGHSAVAIGDGVDHRADDREPECGLRHRAPRRGQQPWHGQAGGGERRLHNHDERDPARPPGNEPAVREQVGEQEEADEPVEHEHETDRVVRRPPALQRVHESRPAQAVRQQDRRDEQRRWVVRPAQVHDNGGAHGRDRVEKAHREHHRRQDVRVPADGREGPLERPRIGELGPAAVGELAERSGKGDEVHRRPYRRERPPHRAGHDE